MGYMSVKDENFPRALRGVSFEGSVVCRLDFRVVESLGVSTTFVIQVGIPPCILLVFGKPFLLYHRSGHFPQNSGLDLWFVCLVSRVSVGSACVVGCRVFCPCFSGMIIFWMGVLSVQIVGLRNRVCLLPYQGLESWVTGVF